VLLVVPIYVDESSDGEDIIRIIPASEADPRERRVYIEQTSD
jgi:hypothetical protein